jgi:Tol biopolymer transport system component
MEAYAPRWSPDGSRIAFHATTPEKVFRYQIYVVPAAGGEPERVFPEEGPVWETQQWHASWSPDGEAILFGDAPSVYGDNRPIRRLDLRTQEVSILPNSEGLDRPRWSPDGSHVAALSRDWLTLLLFDWETQQWEKLVEGPTLIWPPAWSRDGNDLYFQTTDDDGPHISRLRIADGKRERVADIGGFGRTMWFGLDPEDSILLARDAGIQEIYALDFEAP